MRDQTDPANAIRAHHRARDLCFVHGDVPVAASNCTVAAADDEVTCEQRNEHQGDSCDETFHQARREF